MGIPPGKQRWMVVLPPEGAARQVGESAWKAFCAVLPAERRKLFDTRIYLDGFDKLLKDPADDMVVDLLNQALSVQCLDFEATHLLVLALSPVTLFNADILKRHGIVTVHWFYEDFRQAKYWKAVLPAYNHFLAIQRGPIESACREQGVGFHYLPTAYTLPPDPLPIPWRDRTGGIVFVGFPSPYRIAVLEALAAASLPLKVSGTGWEKYRGPLEPCLQGSGWTGPAQVQALLGGAQVGLHLPTEDPSGDRADCHVSPRVFDILLSGCALLCEDAPLIRETIRGCVYREFRGPAQAVEAARQALAAGIPQEAQASNRETVLREHSFAKRIATLMTL